MDKKQVSTQLYMSTETRRRLRKQAADQDMSVNELLRAIAQKHFDAEGIDINMFDGVEERGGYRPRKENAE